MKLYDYDGAPNPRRVKIFAAEKDIQLDLIQCDLAKGEHKTTEFIEKSPSGKIPVLELDDGRCISESVAICRYLEEIYPEPNLFGSTPYELAYIESRNRHLELELWTQIGISWVNGPIVGRLDRFKQIKEAKESSDRNAEKFYERLNDELAITQFVAGDRYTIADITLLTAIDFATAMVDLKPDSLLTHLYRWHKEVSRRPSSSL